MSKSKDKKRCLIGPHASISKGILNAIKYAEYIDGNTLQIFLIDPMFEYLLTLYILYKIIYNLYF